MNKQTEQLKEYDDWPLPEQVEERLTPEYLSGVYTGGNKGIDYGRRFLRQHNLEGSHVGQNFLRILIALDEFLTFDGYNLVNSAGVEVLVRYLYGVEKTMAQVTKKEHWAGAENQRRTNWELFRRYHTVEYYQMGVEVKAADKAVEQGMQQDALFSKYLSKVKGQRDAVPEAAVGK